MQADDLTREQAAALKNKLRPMFASLGKLKRRMVQRGFLNDDWQEYVTRLVCEEGAVKAEDEPTDEEVRRFDRERKNKSDLNDEWVSPNDPESRITQLKEGRTPLA